jgi:hypothetical protein
VSSTNDSIVEPLALSQAWWNDQWTGNPHGYTIVAKKELQRCEGAPQLILSVHHLRFLAVSYTSWWDLIALTGTDEKIWHDRWQCMIFIEPPSMCQADLRHTNERLLCSTGRVYPKSFESAQWRARRSSLFQFSALKEESPRILCMCWLTTYTYDKVMIRGVCDDPWYRP